MLKSRIRTLAVVLTFSVVLVVTSLVAFGIGTSPSNVVSGPVAQRVHSQGRVDGVVAFTVKYSPEQVRFQKTDGCKLSASAV